MTIHPEALKMARVKKGLTRQELAERCRNISPKTIYRYEKGETKPSRKKAQLLAEALGATVEKLSEQPTGDAASGSLLQDEGYVWIRELLGPAVTWNYRVV